MTLALPQLLSHNLDSSAIILLRLLSPLDYNFFTYITRLSLLCIFAEFYVCRLIISSYSFGILTILSSLLSIYVLLSIRLCDALFRNKSTGVPYLSSVYHYLFSLVSPHPQLTCLFRMSILVSFCIHVCFIVTDSWILVLHVVYKRYSSLVFSLLFFSAYYISANLLQSDLHKTRIVYSSSTGDSDLAPGRLSHWHMLVMTSLQILVIVFVYSFDIEWLLSRSSQ